MNQVKALTILPTFGALMLMSAYGSLSFAKTIEAKSKVHEVTVYTEKALVKRQGELELKEGEHQLRFDHLPNDLQTSTVQFQASSDQSAVEVLSIDTKEQDIDSSTQFKKLDKEIDEVEQEYSKKKNTADVLKDQVKLYKNMPIELLKTSKDKVDLEEIKTVAEFSRAEQERLNEELFEQETLLQNLDKKHQKLTKEREQLLEKAKAQPNKQVVVSLKVSEDQKINYDLQYAVSQAGWSPEYNLRYKTGAEQLTFEYGAKVYQETDDSWEDVNLVLSTAESQTGVQQPEQSAWYLSVDSITEVAPQVNLRAAEPLAQEEMTSSAVDAKSYTSNLAESTVQQELIETQFKVEKPITLNQENPERWVPIAQKEFDVSISYDWFPANNNRVFQSAKTKNGFNFPILPGVLNTYVDQRFITTGPLPLTVAGEEMYFVLGTVQGLKVKRSPVKRYEEKKGLLKNHKQIAYQYDQLIENNLDKAIDLNVHYRLPVSTHEAVEVSLKEPKGLEVDQKGLGAAKVHLKEGEKVELPFEFDVTYPKDEKIIGLP